jgi:hypothetical protein
MEVNRLSAWPVLHGRLDVAGAEKAHNFDEAKQ